MMGNRTEVCMIHFGKRRQPVLRLGLENIVPFMKCICDFYELKKPFDYIMHGLVYRVEGDEQEQATRL